MKFMIQSKTGNIRDYQDSLEKFYVDRERVITNEGRTTEFSLYIENAEQLWRLKEEIGDFAITTTVLGEPLILILGKV